VQAELFSAAYNVFSLVNVAAALCPRAKESFKNFRVSAVPFRFSGPFPPKKSARN
jgi:hypothetical protein